MYFFLTLFVFVQNLSVIVNFNCIAKDGFVPFTEGNFRTHCFPGFQLNGLITLFDEGGS